MRECNVLKTIQENYQRLRFQSFGEHPTVGSTAQLTAGIWLINSDTIAKLEFTKIENDAQITYTWKSNSEIFFSTPEAVTPLRTCISSSFHFSVVP
jgi:hypothetical protein